MCADLIYLFLDATFSSNYLVIRASLGTTIQTTYDIIIIKIRLHGNTPFLRHTPLNQRSPIGLSITLLINLPPLYLQKENSSMKVV